MKQYGENKMNVEIISVERSEVYKAVCNSLYDILVDGRDRTIRDLYSSMIFAVESETNFRDACKMGNAFLMLPMLSEKIELLDKENKDFVLMVMDNGKLFAVVNCKEINY